MRAEITKADRQDGLPLPLIDGGRPKSPAGQGKRTELKRQVFTTSREMEYFSESELTTQTGYPKEQWWPGVVVKELLDNSLDACEQAGVVPVISVDFRGQSVVVSDNGPGIASEVVHKILDFSTRTSDKQAYVSPTRGAQGNALKTLLAIPYVLSGGKTGRIEIESQGVRHTISVSTDHIARRPRIERGTEEIVRTDGTSILLKLDSASYPVLPVIGICKAATRPSDNGGSHALQRLKRVEPVAVLVRNLGIGANPSAPIDHPSDVLGEVTVDQGADRPDLLVKVDRDFYARPLGSQRKNSRQRTNKSSSIQGHWYLPGHRFLAALMRLRF